MPTLTQKITLRHLYIFILLATIGICIQCYLASHGNTYTRYNNYVIFKQSFEHLLLNKNLYLEYPAEHYDLFKYSPAFALVMGLFYYLPDFIGILIFNLINAFLFIYAIRRLQLTSDAQKYLLLFVLLEMGISLTSTQTNLVIAGLIILAFTQLEKERYFWAAGCIVATVFIKLFGIVALALWVLYPKKARFAGWIVLWMAILALLPMILIPKDQLLSQYNNWAALLKMDHDASYGNSFMGWIHSWFRVNIPKTGTVLAAAVLFCVPLLKFSKYKLKAFRLQILASILLWVVIFNHRGESPTYIIALAGVGIWYFSQPAKRINKILLWLCLVFTSFTGTDLITPGWIINDFMEPYAIKSVFCCIVWFKLIADLIFDKYIAAPRLEKPEMEAVSIIKVVNENIRVYDY